MRLRLVASALLAGLLLALTSAHGADPKPRVGPAKAPTLTVRLASLDQLTSDFLYLAELVGKGEEAKQAEGFLKAVVGDKGIEGVDLKRPLGLYARVTPGLADSSYALMLPIADESAFLDFLQRLGYKGDKGENGIYKVDNLPNSKFPLFYRLVNKHLYVTVSQSPAILADERLLPPETVLPANDASMLSATINLDQVPEQLREMAVGFLALRLAGEKTRQVPNETAAQRQLRIAAIDEFANQFKALLTDGQRVQFAFTIDRKAGELGVSGSLTAKPGSPLAKTFSGLSRQPSIGASVVREGAAGNFLLHLALPEKLRPAEAAVVDEALAKNLKQLPDQARQLLQPFLESLLPTLKTAEIDAGVSLRGPSKDNKYTAVVAAKVKDGAAIEKAFKEGLKGLPAEQRQAVTLDVDKAAGVSIHKLQPPKTDRAYKDLFGTGPMYFAVRNDALLAAGGEQALPALKEALAAAPKEGKIAELELAFASLAPLIARDNKAAPEAAGKAFKAPGSDRVRVVVAADKGLHFQAGVKAQVIRFFALAEEGKKKAQ